MRKCVLLYLQHVSDFYHRLFEEIGDLQQSEGGNIIAMQIENEYGSYGNDKEYLRYIEKLMLDCGTKVMLFTSDGIFRKDFVSLPLDYFERTGFDLQYSVLDYFPLEKIIGELCWVHNEQKTFGKIHVKTEL